MNKLSRRSKKRLIKNPLVLAALLLGSAGLAFTSLELTNTIDLINSRQSKGYITEPASETRTINQHTKGEPADEGPDDGTKNTPGSTESEKDKDTALPSSLAPMEPRGSFVNNHAPRLSDSPSSFMQSACTTSPGATCKISFKKGSTTVSLPDQLTDKGGSAYWTWKLTDLGLTPGSWTISAKATLNNNTKEAVDSLPLEVGE